MTEWIKNLKVGDKVVVKSYGWGYNEYKEREGGTCLQYKTSRQVNL